jgi:hypothetical protein
MNNDHSHIQDRVPGKAQYVPLKNKIHPKYLTWGMPSLGRQYSKIKPMRPTLKPMRIAGDRIPIRSERTAVAKVNTQATA